MTADDSEPRVFHNQFAGAGGGPHWFPYELTRCARLRDSTVSTRALYGNRGYEMPFPELRPGAGHARTCSVCDKTIDGAPRQVWVRQRVATDDLPLLVNACSEECAAVGA